MKLRTHMGHREGYLTLLLHESIRQSQTSIQTRHQVQLSGLGKLPVQYKIKLKMR